MLDLATCFRVPLNAGPFFLLKNLTLWIKFKFVKSKKKNPTFPHEVFLPETQTNEKINLYFSQISAGFPSPAEDFLEKRLDLNDYLIKNKAATFLIKVQGDSMINAGIRSGDILIIDRSVEASDGKIVLGILNGEFTVKRVLKRNRKLFLMPENDAYQPIEITEEMDFNIWGVVTHSIHKV